MSNKKVLILHPFLFGIYPVIFLYSRNVDEVFFHIAVVLVPIILAFTFALMLLLRCMIKDRTKLGIILSGFWFYFFAYGNVCGKLYELTIGGKLVGRDIFLIPAWTAVFLLGSLLVFLLPKNLVKITRMLNLVAVCLVVMCLGTIAFKYVKTTSMKKEVADIDHAVGFPELSDIRSELADIDHAAGFPELSDIPSELPDIYYIIPDRRVRSDILKKYLGYDDSVFLDQLRERGFFVADKSYSNYIQTKYSILSSLHCMYVDKLVAQYGARSRSGGLLGEMFRTNRVLELFEKFGYTTVCVASAYSYTDFRNVDIFYSNELSYGLSLNEYTNELVSNMVITGAFAGFRGRQTLKAHRDRVLYAFEKLGETATLESPHFVFCHIISPHPPYVFDENGIIDQPGRPFRWSDRPDLEREELNRKYVGQLIFINKKIIETIDKILANSQKPPVIILQSDHGIAWGLGPEGEINDYRAHFGILNAYHFPDGDYSQLYESISPVNSFRVIFNQYFGANLKLLEDRSYNSGYKQPFDFTDKTEEIK